MMKITNIDGIHYVRCGDLDRLLRGLRMDIYAQYKRNEKGEFFQQDGTKGITKDDAAILSTITHIMTMVMQREVRMCETPEDIKKLHYRIESEAYIGRYVITKKDVERKKIFVFVRFSKDSEIARLKSEGKTMEEIEEALEDTSGEPLFSEVWRDAMFFENYEDAKNIAEYINDTLDLDAKVEPAMHINRRAMNELLKDIMKDENREEEKK